jgi:hypothetical protein
MSTCLRLIAMASFFLAALTIASPPAAADPAPPDKDWATLAADATSTLATALDDSARGRPADTRLRSITAAFDDLLAHAPLSDRDRARILYNRGLAQLALHDPAAAIYDLRRADALAPGSQATARELHSARARLAEMNNPTSAATAALPAAGPAEPIRENPAALAWNALRRIDPQLRWTVGLGAFALAWVFLTPVLFIATRPARRPLAGLAGASMLVGITSLATLYTEHRLTPARPEVVVLGESLTPLQGPDRVAYGPANFDGRTTIPRGTELTVIETRSLAENPNATAWLRVQGQAAPTDGPSVWIPASDVGWIRPTDSIRLQTQVQRSDSSSPANAPM